MNECFFWGHLSLRRKWKCLLIENKFGWNRKFFPPKWWDLLLMWKYQRIKVKVNVSEEMGFVACVQSRQLLSICLCEDNSLPFLFINPWSVFTISFKNENIPAYWWKTHTPRITSEFSFWTSGAFSYPSSWLYFQFPPAINLWEDSLLDSHPILCLNVP